MKKIKILFFGLICFLFSTSGVYALQFELIDWAFNIDGAVSGDLWGDDMPVTGELTDGLGTLSWTTSEAGDHSFIAWFDHQIDAEINTFFNETGGFFGTAAEGQSWEVDEPGYLFGDIYNNVLEGTLDESDYPFNVSGFYDDVSMALGWDFSLDIGEKAVIGLALSDNRPETGFYLFHTDPHSDASIYLSSTLDISTVPEPGTMVLLCIGLAGMIVARKKLWLKNRLKISWVSFLNPAYILNKEIKSWNNSKI